MRLWGWLAVAAIAFAAALAGVLVGHHLLAPARQGSELHELLHRTLRLDQHQHDGIEAIERRFAVRRQALEMELRADNARLAEALDAERGDGPRVRAAVDASHHAMGELQKETLAHLFAMRALLRPDQAARFDRAVTDALTAGAAGDQAAGFR